VISIGSYVKQLFKVVLSSSFVLGLILGIALLVTGETTLEADLTFEFGTLDGLWFIVGVPLVSVLVFTLLSPLSFLVYRLFVVKRTEGESPDT
jgi:hypothetical protein